MSKRNIILIILTVVLGALFFLGFRNGTGTSQTASDNEQLNVAAEGSKNFFGKADSKVTLTEFVDFQCEACYAFYPHVKEVKEKYKDRVRFQVRYFPVASHHQHAMLAAQYAEAAARQGKFWEMHDLIFENQPTWSQSLDPTSAFDGYANQLQLDMVKLKSDRTDAALTAVINKDLKDVTDLGGTGTPTFVLNGKMVDSPDPSVEALSKFIDDALADTK